jgi:hypothetical protein
MFCSKRSDSSTRIPPFLANEETKVNTLTTVINREDPYLS